jgi:vancomycin permeability regulator SanA
MESAPKPRRWRRRLALVVVPVFLSLLLLVGDGLTDEVRSADVAVVLGNKVRRDGAPSQHLRQRLERGLALYRDGVVPFLLVSGGLGREGHQEARVMADWLTARGVPPARVVVDPDGLTTHATARNTVRLMRARGWRSALVVSQYYHVTRSKLALRRAGVPSVGGARARFDPSWKEPYALLREVAGLAYYALRRDV